MLPYGEDAEEWAELIEQALDKSIPAIVDKLQESFRGIVRELVIDSLLGQRPIVRALVEYVLQDLRHDQQKRELESRIGTMG